MQKRIASEFTPCCAKLISFSAVHVCPDLFNAASPSHKGSNEYGQGYLVLFAKGKWEEWHRKYALQSGIDFTIGTGKQSYSKNEHGVHVAYINSSKNAYQIKSTQLYNCIQGRRKQLKQKQLFETAKCSWIQKARMPGYN